MRDGSGRRAVPHLPQPDLCRLGPVIRMRRLSEPGMLKCRPRRDALGRIVDKDLLQQIEEVLEERAIRRNDVLSSLLVCVGRGRPGRDPYI